MNDIKRNLVVVIRASNELDAPTPFKELNRKDVCAKFMRNRGQKLSMKNIIDE